MLEVCASSLLRQAHSGQCEWVGGSCLLQLNRLMQVICL